MRVFIHFPSGSLSPVISQPGALFHSLLNFHLCKTPSFLLFLFMGANRTVLATLMIMPPCLPTCLPSLLPLPSRIFQPPHSTPPSFLHLLLSEFHPLPLLSLGIFLEPPKKGRVRESEPRTDFPSFFKTGRILRPNPPSFFPPPVSA